MKILDLMLGVILLVLGVGRILQTMSMDLDHQVVIALIYLVIGVLPGLTVFISGFQDTMGEK